ncbi:MAG: hypothetical protein LUD72_09790 [Bacteroidales bacterium]|nr:hypothetical protein [Bacteroidales bacterium]
MRTVKGKTDKGEVDYEEKVDFEHPDRMIMALLRHEHKWTDTHKPEPETPQLTAKELEMAMATALGLSEFVNRDKVAKIKGLTAEKVRETIRFSVEIDNGEKETEGAVFGEAVGDSLPEVPDSEE